MINAQQVQQRLGEILHLLGGLRSLLAEGRGDFPAANKACLSLALQLEALPPWFRFAYGQERWLGLTYLWQRVADMEEHLGKRAVASLATELCRVEDTVRLAIDELSRAGRASQCMFVDIATLPAGDPLRTTYARDLIGHVPLISDNRDIITYLIDKFGFEEPVLVGDFARGAVCSQESDTGVVMILLRKQDPDLPEEEANKLLAELSFRLADILKEPTELLLQENLGPEALKEYLASGLPF